MSDRIKDSLRTTRRRLRSIMEQKVKYNNTTSLETLQRYSIQKTLFIVRNRTSAELLKHINQHKYIQNRSIYEIDKGRVERSTSDWKTAGSIPATGVYTIHCLMVPHLRTHSQHSHCWDWSTSVLTGVTAILDQTTKQNEDLCFVSS